MRIILAIMGLGILFPSCWGIDGWDNVNPHRDNNFIHGKLLKKVEFKPGLADFKVEYHQGARGLITVEAPDKNSPGVLKIEKQNDVGFIVVRSRTGWKFPARKKLQLAIMMRTNQSAADYSLGMVRLLRKLDDWSYDRSLDGRGGAGPHMQFLMNTPPQVWLRRLAHKQTGKKNEELFPAIIVAGRHSVTWWKKVEVEDFSTVAQAWRKHYNRQALRPYAQDMIPEAEFDRLLAQEVDHTAQVVARDGRTVLLVDGQPTPPDFYKASSNNALNRNQHSGKLFSQAGVKLQVINLRYGDYKVRRSHVYGVWTRDKFDVDSAIKLIKDAMRTAPDSYFVLTLLLNPYFEFGLDYPDEVWRNHRNMEVYGNYVHSPYFLKNKRPERCFPWPSYYSLIWREQVKKHTGELIAALKKSRLSRKIIGIHLGGGHDMQFATRHLDYSRPALVAFKKFLKRRYPTDRALQKAWNSSTVNLDTVNFPEYSSDARFDVFDPQKDQAKIDFFEFQKLGPFEMQEDIARYIKAQFGKKILLMRWCMGAFCGNFPGSLDIGAFNNSDVFDVLIAQSSYNRRLPGIPHAVRLPLASMRLHGKLYLQELDLRTWKAVARETELRCLGLGLALDPEMWQALNRKLSGQMIAQNMGYWYYDMAPGWFDDPLIMADFKDQVKVEQKLQALPKKNWHPDVAFVMDEKGALYRNLPGMYYIFDIDNLIGTQTQILTSSSTPYDFLLLEDLLRKPQVASRYKTLVFGSMYYIDASRQKLLKQLQCRNRTLIFLAGTGRIGHSATATGFKLKTHPMPVREHEVVAIEPAVSNFMSWPKLRSDSLELGKRVAFFHASPWYEIQADPQMQILARYRHQRTPAVVMKKFPGWTSVYIAEPAGLSPEFFNQLVRQSGGFTVSRPGLQIDMNDRFMSIHGIVPGNYQIALPFVTDVVNLKDGKIVRRNCRNFDLSVQAGSTYWFGLLKTK